MRRTATSMMAATTSVGAAGRRKAASPPGATTDARTVRCPEGGQVTIRKVEGGHVATVVGPDYRTQREVVIPGDGRIKVE